MYACIYNYPVALRAISATVPTSFFVLACQRLHVFTSQYCVLCSGVAKAQRKQTHKATTTTKNGRQKLTENHEKLTPGGVPEALGGGLWTISVSGVPQRGPRDARSRKSDEKFVHSSLLPCFLGTPKSYIFGIFRFLCCFLGDVFRKRFLEASGHHF